MARVTIEDSLEKAKNKFAMVILASSRARQLASKEAKPLIESKNREIVTALREIAASKIVYTHPEYLEKMKDSYVSLTDDIEFVDDEDDGE